MSDAIRADGANSGQHQNELGSARLRFLGKHSAPGNSPSLWDTGLGQYVIQGFTLNDEALAQVGDIPDGEAVIWVPAELLRYLPEEHDASTSPHPPDMAA
jgi:hypothetical protein